jgi:hypothetical protein
LTLDILTSFSDPSHSENRDTKGGFFVWFGFYCWYSVSLTSEQVVVQVHLDVEFYHSYLVLFYYLLFYMLS